MMTDQPWYERAWFIKALCYGFALLVAVKFVHSVFFKQNDFDVHLANGALALKATYYADSEAMGPLLFQYPPGRILIDEGLSLLPRLLARAVFFIAAIGSLFFTFNIWRELAQKMKPAIASVEYAAAGLAFLLLANWTIRDFDECGLQILLLFFLSMAARALYRGAPLQSGAWLALAVTFKVTPVIFIPLLIWKRRITEAAVALAFIVLLNVLVPALVWGPSMSREGIVRHIQTIATIAALDDPSENGIEPPSHRSQSLKLAIARYLQTYPPGHSLFIDRGYADETSCADRKVTPVACERHPLFVQFLDLPATTANKIVTAIIGMIALVLAWRLRRRWLLAKPGNETGTFSSLAPEWATACAFASLLSPLNWHQHMVLVLPCAFLVIRDLLLRAEPARLRWAGLAFVFICVWVLHRDPLSKLYSLIAMSYHFDVMAVLILIVLTLTIDRAAVPHNRPTL